MPTLGFTFLLASLTMLGPLGIDAYLPSFHALGAELRADPLVVQQTLSVYTFCLATTMLFYGTLSDSIGRRRVIIGGLVLFIIGSIGAAAAPTIGWLIAARAVEGLAAGAGSVVTRAVVQDRFSGAAAHRVMSHMMMVFGLAPAIAPVVGGWLQAVYGWRAVFGFLTLSACAMLVAVWFCLPESLPPERRQPFAFGKIARNFLRMLGHGRFMLKALAVGAAFTGISLYVGSASHFIIDILHLTETDFAWIFVPMVTGLMTGSAVAPRLLARTSPAIAIRIGFAVMFLGGMVNLGYNLLFTAAVPWAVLPLTLYSFGLAIASPGMSLEVLSTFPEMRGTAASMQSFVQMMTFTVIAGVIAPLLYASATLLALGHVFGAVTCTALWLIATRKPRA